MHPLLLLVQKRDVEGPGEVLAEVVARCGLQGSTVAHKALAGVGLYRATEPFGGALYAGENGDRQYLVEHVPVDAEHP